MEVHPLSFTSPFQVSLLPLNMGKGVQRGWNRRRLKALSKPDTGPCPVKLAAAHFTYWFPFSSTPSFVGRKSSTSLSSAGLLREEARFRFTEFQGYFNMLEKGISRFCPSRRIKKFESRNYFIVFSPSFKSINRVAFSIGRDLSKSLIWTLSLS